MIRAGDREWEIIYYTNKITRVTYCSFCYNYENEILEEQVSLFPYNMKEKMETLKRIGDLVFEAYKYQ